MSQFSTFGLSGLLPRFRAISLGISLMVPLLSCTPVEPDSDSNQAAVLQLRILHTSDIHGKLTGYNYFSDREDSAAALVHAAAVIAEARRQQPNNILIDNGDLIQGDPFADWAMEHLDSQPHPIIATLNRLNYDVANLGNHEFNYGLEALYKTYREAQFTVISSNVSFTAAAPAELRQLVQPWALFSRAMVDQQDQWHELKIAVIGVVPPQIMQWDANLLVGRVTVNDMVAAAQRAIGEVQQAGADLIIIAGHTGVPLAGETKRSTEQVVDQLAQLTAIDAIVFGHQHVVFPGSSSYDYHQAVDEHRGTLHGVPAVAPGYGGSHVGQVDLTLQRRAGRWVVSDASVAALPADRSRHDEALMKELEWAHQQTRDFVQQPVGSSQQQLSYARARLEPSSGVQFVQRAQLWYASERMQIPAQYQQLPLLSAAAPFDAAADANEPYTEIDAGQVSLGQIADLYRYPNTLELVKLTGQQLHDWLEASATAFVEGIPEDPWSWVNKSVPHYNFDSILGLTYQIDPTQPVGQRIKNLSYQGQTLAAEQQFLVLVNSYRASGGGNMPHMNSGHTVLESPDQLPDILRWYLLTFAETGYPHSMVRHWALCSNPTCPAVSH